MRGVALALVWLVATAAATGLAWAGVRSVATDVAAPLPAVVTTVPTPGPADPTPSDATTPTAPTRTFETTGGTATVRFAAGGVEVLGAVPAPGFAVDVEPEDDASTRVDFESDAHRSRLEVWWRDGPRHEIEEEARDGDDDAPGDSSGPSGSSGSGDRVDDDDDGDDGGDGRRRRRGRGGDDD